MHTRQHALGTTVAIKLVSSFIVLLGTGPLDAQGQGPASQGPAGAEVDFGVTSKPVVTEQWPSIDAISDPQRRATIQRLKTAAIRSDLRLAVDLATRSLSEHVNRDRCRRPPLNDPENRAATSYAAGLVPELYWGADRLEDGSGRFGPVARSHALDTGVAHVVGRALWAILLAEETVGVSPSAETVDNLSRYCHDLYDNPDHLGAFIDPANGFERAVVCHDLREGFLGLLSLARVSPGSVGGGTSCEV